MRSLETSDLLSLYEEHGAAPLPPGDVQEQRITVDHPLLVARSRILSLRGLTIIRGMSMARQDLELMSQEAPSPVTLTFYLEGRVNGTWRGSGLSVQSSPGMHGIAFSPEPGFRFQLPKDMRHEVFEVNLSRDYLLSLAHRYPEMFERPLAPILRDEPFAAFSASAALSREATGIAARILVSEDHGSTRRAFIEANVVELLALEIRDLRGDPLPTREEFALRARDIERMRQARAELLARMKEPPTLGELAHLVGTNEFSLKRGFKAAFGSTVFGALFDHRMQVARRMLLETDRCVEQIAEEVGYSSSAHFTFAFKRKYGFPPTSLRQGR